MKAYLDNNVVSALAKDDFADQSAALTRLAELFSKGSVHLVTSKVARKEIERYSGAQRPVVQRICDLLAKVPFVDNHSVIGFHSQWDHTGGSSQPLVEDEPISAQLQVLGVKRIDAHHLMLAIRNSCEVFLTCDGGILHRADEIDHGFQIRVMRPSSFVVELTTPVDE